MGCLSHRRSSGVNRNSETTGYSTSVAMTDMRKTLAAQLPEEIKSLAEDIRTSGETY